MSLVLTSTKWGKSLCFVKYEFYPARQRCNVKEDDQQKVAQQIRHFRAYCPQYKSGFNDLWLYISAKGLIRTDFPHFIIDQTSIG